MTTDLHLPAEAGAPIACDMSTAPDTPDERLCEYARLYEAALVRRDRAGHSVVFAFRAAPGTRAIVEDLARREAACCPFLEHRIETRDEEVIWTVTGPEREGVDVILDELYAMPDHGDAGFQGLLDRLAGGGVPVVQTRADRFERRE